VFTHCTSRPHPASPLAHSSMSSHVTGLNVGVPAPCAVQLDVPAPSHQIDYQYRQRKTQCVLSSKSQSIQISDHDTYVTEAVPLSRPGSPEPKVPSPMPVRNGRRTPLIGAPWVPQSQTVAGAWRARRLNTTVSLTVAPRARERAGVGGLTQPSVWRFPHSLHQAGRSPEGEVSVNHTAHND
jgi:hypothetical protein